jgi:hypothetical protein
MYADSNAVPRVINKLRLPRYSAFVGAIIWIVIMAIQLLSKSNSPDALNLLLALAVSVVAPLALVLVATPNRIGSYPKLFTFAVALQPVAALLAVAALFLEPGTVATLLILPWLLFTGITAAHGFVRLFSIFPPVEELVVDVGLIYVAIGGFWTFLSRAALSVFDFHEPVVTLTAIHFHYISLSALVITGMIGRCLQCHESRARRLYQSAAVGMITAPVLVALGIAFSIIIEAIATILLSLSLATLALLTLFRIVPRQGISWQTGFLVLSSVAVLFTMFFASAYVVGRLTSGWTLTIPTMIEVHGWINAVGFGLLGLFGWAMSTPLPRTPMPGIPFSRLSGKSFIGPHFFDGVIDKQSKRKPTGLVDSLSEYQRPDFPVDTLHSGIRAFYERTAFHGLLVVPEWKPGFRVLSRLYKQISKRTGQMNFPLAPESSEDLIASSIVPLDDKLDGRTGVRAWIRTYEKTGEAVYVAAYATHTHAGHTYMNIAFPLPGGNLTSILRLYTSQENAEDTALILTSSRAGNKVGDEGVYFSTSHLSIRLPMNETISVWAADAAEAEERFELSAPPNTTVVARHDMWLLGMAFLSLYYFIYPIEG